MVKTKKSYYLVRLNSSPNREKIIFGFQKNIKCGSNKNEYQSISGPYANIKLLKQSNNIHKKGCTECNGFVKLDPIRCYLVDNLRVLIHKHHICFSCAFWYEKIELHNDKTFIIDGYRYTDSSEVNEHGELINEFQCKVKKFDGSIYNSSFITHQVEVPKHFRDRIPNNAEFIPFENLEPWEKNIKLYMEHTGKSGMPNYYKNWKVDLGIQK